MVTGGQASWARISATAFWRRAMSHLPRHLITGRRANIQHLAAIHFHFVLHDVTRPLTCRHCSLNPPRRRPSQPRAKLHFAFRLACSPKDYARHPIHTLKVGAQELTTPWIGEAHGSAILLASTSEIYGDPEVSPQTEKYWDTSIHRPAQRLRRSQAVRGSITMAYHREHGSSAHRSNL